MQKELDKLGLYNKAKRLESKIKKLIKLIDDSHEELKKLGLELTDVVDKLKHT